MKKLIILLLLCLFAKPEYSNIETSNYIPEPEKLEFKISENGISILKRFEGLSLTAYFDVTGYAIGYAHHGRVNRGQRITLKQAEYLMQRDIKAIALEMKDNALHITKQSEIDAIYSICYNRGVPNFKKSHLYQLLKSKYSDYRDIQSELTSYYEYLYRKNPKNQTYQDLYYRRVKESMLFFNLQ